MAQNSRHHKNNGQKFLIAFMALFLVSSAFLLSYKIAASQHKKSLHSSEEKTTISKTESKPVTAPTKKEEEIKKDSSLTEVLINSVGDCTIGNDDKFAYDTSLPAMLQKQNSDYSYFFKNVADLFKKDDITTANLETTFTNSTAKADKQFTFKAKPEFARTLTLGNIEAVNLSNNHIYDYLKKGFEDTVSSLKQENIHYFGEGYKWTTEVKGHKFAFLGYRAFYYDAAFLKTLKTDIENLKSKDYIVIINFHWGEENAYAPNGNQKYIGHYAIDSGADLVIGHHPHVMEGIEKYKNKFIAYSLGNFCFGGNSNPYDKDTFILQSKFIFKEKEGVSISIKPIPCSISSVDSYNDYCPTPAEGSKKEQILDKLNKLSAPFHTELKDDFI